MFKFFQLQLITLTSIFINIFFILSVLFFCSFEDNIQNADVNNIKESDFYQIYDKILSKSCAIPSCHDGSFEPNFSSLSSSYATLVWQPLIKNNHTNTYKFRVIPFDTLNSAFLARVTQCCFVDDNDRMPFYDKDGLSQEQILLIKKWILNGAKDIFETIPIRPVVHPQVSGLTVYGASNDSIFNELIVKCKNSRDEIIGYSLPDYASVLKFKLNMAFNNVYLIDTIPKYYIQFYKDVNYSFPLNIRNELVVNDDSFSTFVNVKDFNFLNHIFFRIETSENYFFPNSKSNFEVRYTWSICMD